MATIDNASISHDAARVPPHNIGGASRPAPPRSEVHILTTTGVSQGLSQDTAEV
jgi:hypothetical protein